MSKGPKSTSEIKEKEGRTTPVHERKLGVRVRFPRVSPALKRKGVKTLTPTASAKKKRSERMKEPKAIHLGMGGEGADDVGESDEEKVDQERVEDEPVRDNGIPGNSIDGGLEESDEEAADNDGLYDNRTNPGSKENKSKLLECSICEISFTRNNNLKKHKKTAHGDLAKKYPCTICKKEFKIYGLKDHMNKIHSSKSYHCPQCDYVAPYAARLKTHVQSVHEGIRYPCSHCDYQATKNSDLRKHIRYVHDGVRDFPCSQCDHKAKRKHEFQKHVARRH